MTATLRSKWSLDLFALASMPCGTNAHHCSRALGGNHKRASLRLYDLANSGHLHCVPEDRPTNRLAQYFVHGKDAIAWKHINPKPNVAYRDPSAAAKKNHKPGKSIAAPKTPRRALKLAANAAATISPTCVITRIPTPAGRFAADPATVGAFSALGVGRYL